MDESFELLEFKNLKFEFETVSEQSLLDITNFISDNLKSDNSIADKKNKLLEKKAIKCSNLIELIALIKERILSDYKKCIKEKNAGKWDFNYFLTFSDSNDKTLNVYNRLQPTRLDIGSLFYPLLSIRQYNDSYYYWKH